MGSCCSRRIKSLATQYLPKDAEPILPKPPKEVLDSEYVEEFEELEGVHTE